MVSRLNTLILFAVPLIATSIFASGTVAGTQIQNTATLTYNVGDQEKTVEAAANFLVDDKVNVVSTTVDTQAVTASTGSTNVVLTFKVRNDGNSVHDFLISSLTNSSKAFVGTSNEVTDSNNADNVRIYVDNGDDTFNPDEDTETYIDELAPDEEKTVFIVADIPDDAADGDIAVYDLQVQVAEGGASGTQGEAITSDDSDEADAVNTVQIVFADGAGTIDAEHDGKFSSTDAYKMITATVTIIKNSIVLSDPVNDTTNPKRIPGAVVRYCFIVENTGSSDATDVLVTDDMDENVFDFANSAVTLYKLTDDACECDTMEDVDGANGSNGQDPTNDNDGVAKVDFGTLSASSKKCGYVTAEIK
ncbi:MAG: hypothetical protein GXO30_05015 [Epsilonproteobacteria bacterium]|nr:hypothetical protein [Campylobacterota bacterium]